VASAAEALPRGATFALDWRVAFFAVGLAVATTVLFGWAPALHAIRGDLRGAMQDAVTGASTVSPRGRRTLTGLVGAQFALAAVLLVGGALFARAFGQVRAIDPGYRPDGVLLFSVALPPSVYDDGSKRIAFWDSLLERLRRAPGVDAAGVISCPPLGCHWGNFYQIEGRPAPKPGEPDPVILSRLASAGYFEAMGLRLREGRFFDDRDGRDGAPPAVIVNETFVRTFWPNDSSVLGRRLRFNGEPQTWITVVGVAEDVKHYGLERPMRPGLYFPAAMLAPRTATMTVAVHTKTDPDSFGPAARGLLQELDPALPMFGVATAAAMLSDSMRARATYSWMLAVFAALTVVLALGGTYGVTSYLVTQRAREIGIRMAIGAQARDIVRAMLRGTALVVAVGVAAGLLTAMLLAPRLGDLLFGISPRDPLVLGAAALVLAAAALAAMIVPARRAARSDPMLSLRA
jgi:predicted permease